MTPRGTAAFKGRAERQAHRRDEKSVQESENPQGTHGFILEFDDVTSLGNSNYSIASPLHFSSVLGVLNGMFAFPLKEEGKKRENISLKLTVHDV